MAVVALDTGDWTGPAHAAALAVGLGGGCCDEGEDGDGAHLGGGDERVSVHCMLGSFVCSYMMREVQDVTSEIRFDRTQDRRT